MPEQPPTEPYAPPSSPTTTLAFKLVVIAGLLLSFLIPVALIDGLVLEREQRRNQAITEIHGSWANHQLVAGPFLVVPVRTTTGTVNAYFLPEALRIDAQMGTEIRHRGIYSAAVFKSDISLSGRFSCPDFSRFTPAPESIFWDRASIYLAISDMRGVGEAVRLDWDGQAMSMDAGTSTLPELSSGVMATVAVDPRRFGAIGRSFSLTLNLKGSQRLSLLPVGKVTTASIRSPWPAPSFRGNFLPEARTVGPNGFSATRKVLDINRGLPQAWIGDRREIRSSAFGVDLSILVDNYRSALRATKYAILFVFSAFVAFFFIEFLQDKRIHPIQYLLIGCATIMFYLLLLSLSEHVRFSAAYFAAAFAVVILVGTYTHGVFARRRITSAVTLIYSGLYAYLFSLLRMEDYSLLLGSLGLFIALGLIMHLTRKVDWYKLEQAHAPPF